MTSPASSTKAPTGPAVEVSHGSRTAHQVALTFHGAGDDAIARDLLAIFAAHHAKVTVFAVGTWLSQSPDVARQVVAGGHEMGNHTYNHLDIDSLSSAQAASEIVRCRDLLKQITGSGGAHFRPSQAQHATSAVLAQAGKAGYRTCVSYDVDSLDYTDPGAAAVRQNVATAQPGSIVSLHFGHAGTVAAMPQILTDLADRGLTPVTTTTLLSAP